MKETYTTSKKDENKNGKYVRVKVDFMKPTDIITGKEIVRESLIDERYVTGKIVKEDKFSNSEYKYKVRVFPNVYKWCKASEIKYM